MPGVDLASNNVSSTTRISRGPFLASGEVVSPKTPQKGRWKANLLSKRFCKDICRATSSPAAEKDSIQRIKEEIVHLAGSKYGTDRPPDIKGAIANLVSNLDSTKTIKVLNMTGSKWGLVYTESTASSSGKIGPFNGKVIQEFPAEEPGTYINWLYLGPLAISLGAYYEQTSEELIDVSFRYFQVELGIWKWKKDMKAKGFWKSIYIEDRYRVLKANTDKIFILEKID